MITLRQPKTRKGYTLLEVVLAATIGMVIMYGIYTAIRVQLSYAQAGRDRISGSTLARSLFARISSDITPSVGLPDPGLFRVEEEEEVPLDEELAAELPEELDPGNQRILAVVGDQYQVRLFISRVPRQAYIDQATLENLPDDSAGLDEFTEIISDQRQVIYWHVPDNSGIGGGLARQEIKQVTANLDEQPIAAESGDEEGYIIAPEVKSLSFRYWDGLEWFDVWDGTELGADLKTPKGPPLAIEILLDLEVPSLDPMRSPRVQSYRHVVHIPTANGPTFSVDDPAAGLEP